MELTVVDSPALEADILAPDARTVGNRPRDKRHLQLADRFRSPLGKGCKIPHPFLLTAVIFHKDRHSSFWHLFSSKGKLATAASLLLLYTKNIKKSSYPGGSSFRTSSRLVKPCAALQRPSSIILSGTSLLFSISSLLALDEISSLVIAETGKISCRPMAP